MLPLVEFPEVVERYAPWFEEVFSPQAYIEFKRYVSGLMVLENKTVEGINRLMMVEARSQSSLNRLLNRSPFSLEALNEARLAMLASQPGSQMKEKGVLSVDDTLLTHTGRNIEHIAKLYDHVSGSYVWAHNLVTLHYSDDWTDYPVRFALWKPVDVAKLEEGMRAAGVPIKKSKETLKESAPDKWRSYLVRVWKRRRGQYPQIQTLYATKLDMAQAMLQAWATRHPSMKLPVTFDSWYTQPSFCRFIDETLHLPYVGTLTEGDKVVLQEGKVTLGAFVKRLQQEHREALRLGKPPLFKPITISFKGEREQYFSYCKTHRIHSYGKKRLVINFRQADLTDTPTILISNRLRWQARGITRIRRHRWPVEVYHQEGKAEGLDQYQLRNFSAIERHIALVAVVYSMLRTAQQDPDLHTELQRQLKIELEGHPAAWRRTAQAHALWSLALFISAGLTQGHTLEAMMAPLIHAICQA